MVSKMQTGLDASNQNRSPLLIRNGQMCDYKNAQSPVDLSCCHCIPGTSDYNFQYLFDGQNQGVVRAIRQGCRRLGTNQSSHKRMTPTTHQPLQFHCSRFSSFVSRSSTLKSSCDGSASPRWCTDCCLCCHFVSSHRLWVLILPHVGPDSEVQVHFLTVSNVPATSHRCHVSALSCR